MKIILPTIYGRTRLQKFSLGSIKVASLLPKEAEIILLSFEDSLNEDLIANDIIKQNPDIIAFGLYIWNHRLIENVAKIIKKKIPKAYIIYGGPIITKPGSLNLKEYLSADIYILGEGEIPLLEVYKSLKRQNNLIFLDSIQGVYTKKNVESTNKTPWMQDLNCLVPVYGNEDLPFHKFSDKENWKYVWWETSRGCVYECGFCDHDNQFKKFRLLPIEILQKEFEEFIKKGVEFVYIVDPILGGSTNNGKLLFEMLSKFEHNITLFGFMRPEFLNSNYLNLLVKAKITELQIGIQTINENVPFWIRKNNYKKIEENLKLLSTTTIKWRADLIIGLPGDDINGLRNSFKVVIENCKPTSIRAYKLSVIPGTPLYNYALKEENRNWIDWDIETTEIISSFSFNELELIEMIMLSNFYCGFYNYVLPQNNLKTEEEIYDLYLKNTDKILLSEGSQRVYFKENWDKLLTKINE